MRIRLSCICLIIFTAASVSAENTITFYRDGALFQQEAAAAKGTIDVRLAAGLLEHTLTITPAPGTTIRAVEAHKADQDGTVDKHIESLSEQRRKLEDRLQALASREAIFTSAAKAQSGKAPRKTKANPDPMQAIRQGTDFAIAQLEAVYTARRKTMQEIKKTDGLLATARKNNRPADNSLRIAITPPRGRVTVRYATTEIGWQPHYNLHLAGDGTSRLEVSATITGGVRGYQVRVSSASLADSAGAETFPAPSGNAALGSYRMLLQEESATAGIYNRFSGLITNSSPHYLPPGDSGLFRGGAYVGRFRFEGLSSGRSRVISTGK